MAGVEDGEMGSPNMGQNGNKSEKQAILPTDKAADNVDSHAEKLPDGGWGWIIVFGSLLIQMFHGLIGRAFGVIYLELLNHYGSSPSVTGGIGAVTQTATGVFGPLVSLLCDRFSCRTVAILGGIICALGFIFTALSPNIYVCYFTFGIIVGGGSALVLTPGYLIITHYFDQRRALAMGIVSIGSSLGVLVFPPIMIHLYEEYDFTGATLILGAVCLHSCVAGALFRPREAQLFGGPVKPQTDLQNGRLTNDDPGRCSEDEHSPTRWSHLRRYDGTTEADVEESHKPSDAPKLNKPSLFDITIFCDPSFIGLFMMFVTLIFTVDTEAGYLPAFVVENGATEADAAVLITITGITTLIGNTPLGFLLDRGKIRVYRIPVYVVFNVTVALCCIIQPYVTSYPSIVVLVIVRILAMGLVMSQRVTIVGDVLGQKRISNALGFCLLAGSIGSLLGRTLGGILEDQLGTYSASYFLAGVLHTAGILSFILAYVLHH